MGLQLQLFHPAPVNDRVRIGADGSENRLRRRTDLWHKASKCNGKRGQENDATRSTKLKMPQKKPFVLRLDPDLLKAVEKWAADEFRSTNGQIEWIISKALKDAGRLKSKGRSD